MDSTDSSVSTDDQSQMDEMDNEVAHSIAGGGLMEFSRDKKSARLQDFEIRKLIGKGSFGKVFLV